MKKRLFAALLCVLMVMALLPATAFAANANNVWIFSNWLGASRPYYVNGEDGAAGTTYANDYTGAWNAYFDASNGTLTLNGLSVVESKAVYPTDDTTWTMNALCADGDLTILVNGTNSISTTSYSEDNPTAAALLVQGDLTVKPVTDGSGSLTAVSDAAIRTEPESTQLYGVFAGGTLTVESGATLTGQVTGTANATSQASCLGVYANAVNVKGGTLNGTNSAAANGPIAINCGIYAKTELTLTAGSVSGTGAAATGAINASYGIHAANSISVSGGELYATCGSATAPAALNKALALGKDVTAQGSASADGADPEDYVGTDNSDYQWVYAYAESTLVVTASPAGSVAATTLVILTATPENMTTSPTEYCWYSNTTNSTEGANEISAGGNKATFKPSTGTAGTLYYYCMANDITSNIIAVTVNQPTGGGDTPSSPVTVYNDPSQPDATIWLTGSGLQPTDLLVTQRDPSGSAYEALMKLANSDDVFATYNIHLRSGPKNSGNAMHLTFDLNERYAGQDFTLVHQKTNGAYEYFYDAANQSGDLTYGPLYELSPFMLVRGRLEPVAEAVDVPKTGDRAQPVVWLGILLLAGALLTTSAVLYRRRQNG